MHSKIKDMEELRSYDVITLTTARFQPLLSINPHRPNVGDYHRILSI